MNDEGNQDDRSVDYLVCRECSTPCYIFEMDGERIVEALCQTCGNEEPGLFLLGDVEEDS
jgi:hypothetical protein